MAEWIDTFTPWFIAVAGIISGTVVAWINKRGTREQSLIDQLQEERDASDAARRHAERKAELQEVEKRILIMYIWTLHEHINLQKPPPPPAWPEGLTTPFGGQS